MDLNKIIEIGNEIGQWMNIFEKAPQVVKDKLPMFLGLSLEDERRWDRLWAQLTRPERKQITEFLFPFEKYEQDHFRHVVVGIPSGEGKTTKTGKGKDEKTVTEPGENFALKFLRGLAKLIQEEGADEARKQCEVGGTLVKDPLSQQVIRKWKEGVKWFETEAPSYLGITTWEEFSFEKLDTTVAGKLRAARLARRNPQVTREKIEIPGKLELITVGYSKKISARGSKIKNAGCSRFNPLNWFSKKI